MWGAGDALLLLLRSRTIKVVGGWWCASVGNGAIGVALLCMMPGPFDPVDRGRRVVRLVHFNHHGWMARRSQQMVVVVQRTWMDGIVRLCMMPGPSCLVDSMWGVLVVPPTGERGGGSAALWPLVGRDVVVVDDRYRALVRNARAFGPGGRWCGGMPLVLSDHQCGHRGAWLWPLAGCCLVVPHNQCCMLLHHTRAPFGCRGSVGGGTCPRNMVGGSTPSHRCIGVGP